MFFQFSTTHHFFSFNCIILDRPKGKAVRNISAHTKRAPLAIRTLSPRVVSWFVAVFLRQPFQKGGFVTVLPRRPFCRISSRLATGHRLSRSGGYARSLGSFTIIVGFKTCAGNFAQRTRIFLIDKRKKKKSTPRQARDAFSALLLGCNSRSTLPVSPTTYADCPRPSSPQAQLPPQQDVRGTNGTRSTSSHGMRVIIGFSGLTRRGHRTPSPTSFVRHTIR